ncbi:hypothetical protein DNK56_26205 [Streptomyces sp. AC1-42W]|nr:hypothetical protein DNK56_26205 [Streptomyces sp. AC1-42W]PZT79267.1 hypothetical protein DNK55_06475 [Streptomyces sp. AC1-42T]
MRQSNARTMRNWMSEVRPERVRGVDYAARPVPNPYALVAAVRRSQVDRRVEQIRSRHRTPRVCLYALSGDGESLAASLNSAAAYAEARSWQVSAGRSHSDLVGQPASSSRPGWRLVKSQVRAGFADGVVVATAEAISTEFDEYRRELDWFASHFAFVAVVTPEAVGLP